VTCLCILAVDFKIFPRRYAKAETYGSGIMDLGVGSFVVANALVSRQARNVTSMSFRAALSSISPLVFLGFARIISTLGVDYQVPFFVSLYQLCTLVFTYSVIHYNCHCIH